MDSSEEAARRNVYEGLKKLSGGIPMTADLERLLRDSAPSTPPRPRSASCAAPSTTAGRRGLCAGRLAGGRARGRRAPGAASSASPTRTAAATPCSSDLAARVSPRMLEAPARLDDVRRELDEYFAGRRARLRPRRSTGALTRGFTRRVLQSHGADPVRRGRHLPRGGHRRRQRRRPSAPPATRWAPTRCRSSSPATASCAPAARSAATPAACERKELLLTLEGTLPR